MGPEELQLPRVSRDTQSRELRFRVLLAEGGARRVNLIRARRSSSEHSGMRQVPARIAPGVGRGGEVPSGTTSLQRYRTLLYADGTIPDAQCIA